MFYLFKLSVTHVAYPHLLNQLIFYFFMYIIKDIIVPQTF